MGSMTTLSISLPQSLKDFVDGQAEASGFGTPDEEQKRCTDEILEAALLAGLNSGEALEVTPEYWEQKRARLIERHQEKTGTR